MDVKYRSPDPALAASISSSLVQSYIQRNLEYRFLASKEASDWLGERLAEQRKHVEAAEMALQQYRERHDGISLHDNQNIVVQKLADLNAAVTRAKTDRIQKEALYRQVLDVRRRSGQDGDLDAATERIGLGRVLLARSEAQQAEPLLRQALQIRLRFLPARHWEVAEARSALGGALVALRRYPEAERLLLDALIVLRAHGGSGQETRATAVALVRLHEAAGHPEKAEPYRALSGR